MKGFSSTCRLFQCFRIVLSDEKVPLCCPTVIVFGILENRCFSTFPHLRSHRYVYLYVFIMKVIKENSISLVDFVQELFSCMLKK